MKFAHYHFDGRAPQLMAVVKEHDDETVDLAYQRKGKAVSDAIITRCVVLESPKHGHCTEASDEDVPAAPKETKEPETPKTKAKAGK